LIKKEFTFKLFAALQIYQVLLAELQKINEKNTINSPGGESLKIILYGSILSGPRTGTG